MGAVSSAFQTGKIGLLGTLYLCHKKVKGHAVLTVIGLIIKWLQLATFLVENYHSYSIVFEWSDKIEPLRVLTGITGVNYYFSHISSTAFLSLYGISLGWVICFLALLFYGSFSFSRGEVKYLLPLQILRAVGAVSASILYIPLLTMLLAPYAAGCNTGKEVPHWARSGFTCYEGGHLALTVISTVLAFVFAGLSSVFALTMIDSHPLSPSLAAKSTGSVDFALLVIKTVLVVLGHIAYDKLGTAWVLVGLNAAAAVAWLALLLHFLPFRFSFMLKLSCALATCYLYTCVCAALTFLAGFDAAVMLYVGLPFAALAGVSIASQTSEFVLTSDPSKLRSPNDFDYRVHAILGNDIDASFRFLDDGGSRSDPSGKVNASSRNDDHAGKGPLPEPTPKSLAGTVSSESTSSPTLSHPPLVRGGSSRRSLLVGASRIVNRDGPFGGRTVQNKDSNSDAFLDITLGASSGQALADKQSGGLAAAAFRVADSETRSEMARERLSEEVLKEVENLYWIAETRFPSSAMLHSMQARFWSVYHPDGKRQASQHFMQASRLNPSLWVQFDAFSFRRQQDSENAGSGELPVMKRIQFDKCLADARRATLQTSTSLVNIWTELAEATPDLSRLQHFATLFSQGVTEAEACFTQALSINPQSLSLLRLSSQFSAIIGDRDKSLALASEADRIEESRNKELSNAGSQAIFSFRLWEATNNTEAMSDCGMVNIGSMSSRDLGIITSATAAVSRMFGYSRQQMERRSLSVLLPSPLGETLLSRLHMAVKGESSKSTQLFDTIRSVFGRSRTGAIFPMYIMIRERDVASGAGTSQDDGHGLVAMMRSVQTPESFMLLDSQLRILSADSRSLTLLLNCDATTLQASELHLPTCISDLDDVFEDLQEPNGCLVSFSVGGAGAEGSSNNSELLQRAGSMTGLANYSSSYRLRARLQLIKNGASSVAVFSWRLSGAARSSGSSRRPLAVGRRDSSASRPQVNEEDGTSALNALTSRGTSASVRFATESSNPLAPASSSQSSLQHEMESYAELDSAPIKSSPLYAQHRLQADKSTNKKATAAIPRADNQTTVPFTRDSGDEQQAEHDDSDSQSNGSRSSRSSKTSGSKFSGKTLNRFRRMWEQRSRRPSNTITNRLIFTSYIMLLLCTALAIVAVVLVDQSLATHEETIRFLSLVGKNTASFLSIHHVALIHALYLRGWRMSTPENENTLLGLVSQYSNEYRSRHLEILNMVSSGQKMQSSKDLISGVNTHFIDFFEADTRLTVSYDDAKVQSLLTDGISWALSIGPDLVISKKVPTSLTKLGFQLANAASQYALLDPLSSGLRDNFARTLIENGRTGSPAVEIHRDFVAHAFYAAEKASNFIQVTALYVFVAMGPVFCLLLLCTLLPILYSVHKKRQELMLSLIDIPQIIMLHLRAQAMRRRRELRTGDDDEDDDDSDDDGEGVTPAYVLEDDANGEVEWLKLLQVDAIQKTRDNARSKKSSSAGSRHLVKAGTVGGSGSLFTSPKLRHATNSSIPVLSSRSSDGAGVRTGLLVLFVRLFGDKHGPTVNGTSASKHDIGSSRLAINLRPHRNGARSALGLIKFLAPIAYIFIYFLVFYLWSSNEHETLESLSLLTTLSVLRAASLRQLYSQTTYYLGLGTGFPSEMDYTYAQSMKVIKELTYVSDMLLYNDASSLLSTPEHTANIPGTLDLPSLGTPEDKEAVSVAGLTTDQVNELKSISFGDACDNLQRLGGTEDNDVLLNVTECRLYHSGLAKSGLNALINDALLHARRLVTRRTLAYIPVTSSTGLGTRYTISAEDSGMGGPLGETVSILNGTVPHDMLESSAEAARTFANNTEQVWSAPYSVAAELSSDNWVRLRKNKQLAMPLLERKTDMYLSASSQVLHAFRDGLKIYVSVAVVLLIIGTITAYLPAIKTLEREIHQKRGLLLLLPIEVISNTPSVENLMRRILAENDVAASAAGGGALTAATQQAGDEDAPVGEQPPDASDYDSS